MSQDARWFFAEIKSVLPDGTVSFGSKPFEGVAVQLPYFQAAMPGDVYAILVTKPEENGTVVGQCIGARFLNRPGLPAPRGIYLIQTPHGYLVGAHIEAGKIKPIFAAPLQNAMPFGDAAMAAAVCALLIDAGVECVITPVFAPKEKQLLHLPHRP